ncbi:MAG: response regulator transcription factor [Anaerolineae bacterium]|nr:response regulator transcription factor [Anaerolineae bacterium]
MKSIRVLLADDHTLLRAGLRTLLQKLEGITVVAEAKNGHEALSMVEAQHPDVVLMDIAMPLLNGLETTARILEKDNHARVIILSMHSNEEYVLRALRVGAAGYLLKDAGPDELEHAVRSAAQGEVYLSPPISKQVAQYVRRTGKETSPFDSLTSRQREVLQLIAEGHTNRKIAQLLGVGVKTVESHRANLMKRLDIHDTAGLVWFAIQNGLVAPER